MPTLKIESSFDQMGSKENEPRSKKVDRVA